MRVHPILRRLLTEERAATAIEYGLIAALVGMAIVGSLDALNAGIVEMYDSVETAVSDNVART